MKHKRTRFDFSFIAVITGAFVAALVFNILYQAQYLQKRISSSSDIAVFVYKSYETFSEDIKKEIYKVENVKDVKFFDSASIYKEAAGGDSLVKGVLLSGENPFSPYFLVKISPSYPSTAEKAKTGLKKINGVEDVSYDPNIFMFSKKLQNTVKVYLLVFISALIILFISVIVKIVYRTVNFEARPIIYLYNSAWGVLYGFIAVLAYYLIFTFLIGLDEFIVPIRQLLLIWPVGVLLNLALKD